MSDNIEYLQYKIKRTEDVLDKLITSCITIATQNEKPDINFAKEIIEARAALPERCKNSYQKSVTGNFV